MKFHHVGIATKNIDKTLDWVKTEFNVVSISEKIFDKNQDAYLQMIETTDVNLELVSGNIVEKFIKKNITYYHICYEIDNLEESIKNFSQSIVISKPMEAVLFNNRRVAFLLTPIGIVELLESKKKEKK
ncbi:MAG: Methylmalonyl-CoA epimerase [uncultured Sulfurovum sp.]|uniref:Methylmalonyl-CoA epimerase n=1 Tax=uncultured Sulfurovum sp. TaxID=269237 RepID=A0A6S6UCN8_9BACT|nr:MAG: Methylmalonyl-CoA epimerase [uncultured Sulfurovum sp.]